MSSQTPNEYRPDYVSPPGETLLETLRAVGWTQVDLADRMGRTPKAVNEIIKGKAPITPDSALRLERVLGIPASFWNSRESHYREFLARRKELREFERDLAFLSEIPVAAMVRYGWIRRLRDRREQLREVLSFFGVASVEQWRRVWSAVQVSCRKSRAFESDPGAVAAWLRKGELEAQRIECVPYGEDKFRHTLEEARALTVADPAEAVTRLATACANSGVAVVFVRELPRIRLSGATRWLSPGKALIQMSLRYKSDDQLWFTFFHEAGHILLHGKRAVFVDNGSSADKWEREADQFAADTLIPAAPLAQFVRLLKRRPPTGEAIARLAGRLGVAPGIVVGRLQHDGHVEYSHFNRLKRGLKWPED